MTPDDAVLAIGNLMAHGQILPAAELLGRIRIVVDDALGPEVHLTVNHGEPLKGDPGPGVHCCLCLNTDQGRVIADVLIEGYSLCEDHGAAVMNHAPNIWYDTRGGFAFAATVETYRRNKQPQAT